MSNDNNNNASVTSDSSVRKEPIAPNWWKSPYFLGTLSILLIAISAISISLLLICRNLHHRRHCSLFLVEMAVGCLTTEAIAHLLPTLIVTHKERTSFGMPVFFPRLVTVTACVCLLHTLDTASIVFYGRRQSTSHAMELREDDEPAAARPENRHQDQHQIERRQQQQPDDKQDLEPNSLETIPLSDVEGDCDSEGDGSSSIGEPENLAAERRAALLDLESSSIRFEDDSDSYRRKRHGATRSESLGQVLNNPKLLLQPGPYRLCSVLSAGAILHSFSDGIAIGASFVKGWETGLHMSVSVGMHELAHKVADFSVLTASGFSVPVVVLLNCVYWTAALIGLFLSVPLSQSSEVVRLWFVTLSTAVYVYISLVTMSSMVRKNYFPQHISAFIIGNIGMTTGFILIMLASMLEFGFAST